MKSPTSSHRSDLAATNPAGRCVDVACTVCGCVCDDLQLSLEDGAVREIFPPCPLAEPWWALHAGPAAAAQVAHQVERRPASWSEATRRAAEILRASRAPLIYGLSRSSTPGQRAATRLADQLGAVIDTTASTCHAPSIMALQQVGESTCSLGEVKNRADVVVYWGSNPLVSHPRHWPRLVDSPGMFVPQGRPGRRVIVVDCRDTETTAAADEVIRIASRQDFELIWAVRGALRGEPLPASVGGVAEQQIRQFAERLKAARYGVFFFGLGLTRGGSPHATVEALLRLTTDLNAFTRFTARRMRVPGDVAGADSVLCWQTGFPFSVNLARGYPRYNPDEYAANRVLERDEADAVVLVGGEGVEQLSPRAHQRLRTLPVLQLDPPSAPDAVQRVAVRFQTSIYGVHRPGTAYRMDETPIPLRPILPSRLPADHQVLQELSRLLRRGADDADSR